MVSLAQTMYKSCTDTNNVSKRTETWFHMTHVTLEFHQERPKLFMSLWYVWHKLCTYLASRLALSPNGPIQASSWATSPRSTICCVQNDFWAYGTFSGKPCTYLALILTLSPNGGKRESRWATAPKISIGCIKNDFWANGAFGANHAPILCQD
jgi:hypothetical protein